MIKTTEEMSQRLIKPFVLSDMRHRGDVQCIVSSVPFCICNESSSVGCFFFLASWITVYFSLLVLNEFLSDSDLRDTENLMIL